jgi:hypothetical protein
MSRKTIPRAKIAKIAKNRLTMDSGDELPTINGMSKDGDRSGRRGWTTVLAVALAAAGLLAAGACACFYAWGAKSRDFHSAVAGCNRLRVWRCTEGLVDGEQFELCVLDIRGQEEVARIAKRIRVKPSWMESDSSIATIFMNSEVAFSKDDKVIAELGLSLDGTRLTWPIGGWLTAGELTEESAKSLRDLLEGPEARIPFSVAFALTLGGSSIARLGPGGYPRIFEFLETCVADSSVRHGKFDIFRISSAKYRDRESGYWTACEALGSCGPVAEAALLRRIEQVDDPERKARLLWALVYFHSETSARRFARALANPELKLDRLCPPRSHSFVEWGLWYLTGRQEDDGRWDAAKWGAGSASDVEVTALSLLAYLAAGYTGESGRFQFAVNAATKYLSSKQTESGLIGSSDLREHATAGLALTEYWAMTKLPALEKPVRQAHDYLRRCQLPSGAWPSRKSTRPDDATDILTLMMLKSGKLAGIKLADQALKKAGACIQSKLDAPPKSQDLQPVPGAYLASFFSGAPDDQKRRETLRAFLELSPRGVLGDPYACWFATLGSFNHGGSAWKSWDPKMKARIFGEFRTKGPDFGGWLTGGEESQRLGKIGTTALRLLVLEIYYRYLPIYSK